MSDVFERPIYTRLRRLCLALPATSEKTAWGHPNFRVGAKTFCAFEVIRGRPSVAFRLPSAAVVELIATAGFATPYGRGVWASVWLDGRVDWKRMRALVDVSYRTMAPKRLARQAAPKTGA
jgi:predicted DNA-binding protein (MmcQ/YjbR family)